jgi:glycosyltransferase involved in cell wall biosynthesis
MAERTIICMPAYNAAKTIRQVVDGIPAGSADEILVIDDASQDDTVEVARTLPVTVVRHERNLGYGGNQKTCYREALARGADYVVLLHPDDQYDARVIPAALTVLQIGVCDVVLGNRIRTRREALEGGMPIAKYLANRALTLLENMLTGQNLGEWHSGFRAYRRSVLEALPWRENSDDFVFDSQFLLQCVHFGFRLGDVPVPVRYFPEASTISTRRAARYALTTLRTLVEWQAHRAGLRRSQRFTAMSAGPVSVRRDGTKKSSEPAKIRQK